VPKKRIGLNFCHWMEKASNFFTLQFQVEENLIKKKSVKMNRIIELVWSLFIFQELVWLQGNILTWEQAWSER
jgi:hypothetical protein